MWSRRQFVTASTALACSRAPAQLQFKAGTSLVLAPATVTDRSGKLVRGILAEQFVLSDQGVRREVRAEDDPQPVALVLALHASFNARKPLDRMRKAVSLFGPLVVGANGEAALVALRDDVQTVVPLTSDFTQIEKGVKELVARHAGCSLVDAVKTSAEMLRDRGEKFRKVVVVMAEDRDDSSKSDLKETLVLLQKLHITVYALTYSPGLMQLGREVPTGP